MMVSWTPTRILGPSSWVFRAVHWCQMTATKCFVRHHNYIQKDKTLEVRLSNIEEWRFSDRDCTSLYQEPAHLSIDASLHKCRALPKSTYSVPSGELDFRPTCFLVPFLLMRDIQIKFVAHCLLLLLLLTVLALDLLQAHSFFPIYSFILEPGW